MEKDRKLDGRRVEQVRIGHIEMVRMMVEDLVSLLENLANDLASINDPRVVAFPLTGAYAVTLLETYHTMRRIGSTGTALAVTAEYMRQGLTMKEASVQGTKDYIDNGGATHVPEWDFMSEKLEARAAAAAEKI